MKKLLAYLVIFLTTFSVGFYAYDWHRKKIVAAYVSGIVDGAKLGEVQGIFTCPCWDREGSFCSLCGVKLTQANIFQIINDD